MSNRRQEAIDRIMERYFRPTIANPSGTVAHYGDCWWFSARICTCGLLDDLTLIADANEIYQDFEIERAEHMRNLSRVEAR